MSSSKMKKQKMCAKDPIIESDSEPAEVLVLPPSLLQKLGISLRNIDAAHDHKELSNGGIDAVQENELSILPTYQMPISQKNDIKSDTSIMETANLMKESVFLSPIFSTSSANISGNMSNDLVSSTILSDGKSNNDEIENEGRVAGSLNQNVGSFTKKSECMQDKTDVISLNSKKQTVKKGKIGIADKSIDDHESEKKMTTNKPSSPKKSKNKICVISEEIIAPRKLKELKPFYTSSNSTLIPVPINSVITTDIHRQKSEDKYRKSYLEHNLKHQVSDITNINDTIEIEKKNSLNVEATKLDSYMTELSEDETSNLNTIYAISSKEDLSTIINDVTDKNQCNDCERKHSDNKNVVEGSHYFTTVNINCVTLRTENQNNTGANELGKDIIQSNDNMICQKNLLPTLHNSLWTNDNLNIKENPLKKDRTDIQSKSHIQGVEKPGGKDILTKNYIAIRDKTNVPRTYSRTKPTLIHVPVREACSKLLFSEFNIDTKHGTDDIIHIDQIFCHCYDFGCYSYFNPAENYEHIHCWKHDNSECSPYDLNVLFSIYDDSRALVASDDQSIENEIENVHEDNTNEDAVDNNKICFSIFGHDFALNSEREAMPIMETDIEADGDDASEELININEQNLSNVSNRQSNASELVSYTKSTELPQEDSITLVISKESNLRQMSSGERIFQIEIDISSNETPSKLKADHIQQQIMTRTKRKRLDSDECPLNEIKKKSKSKKYTSEAVCDVHSSRTLAPSAVENTKTYNVETTVNSKIENIDQNETLVCGICQRNLTQDMWIEHISKEHSYLAWKENDTPLDFTNEEVVIEHLNKILNEFGHLICGRCGLQRDDAKKYLRHVNNCSAVPGDLSIVPAGKIAVKCGVCQKEVIDWLTHIAEEHNYLAWKEGELPIDFDDENNVRQYLHSMAKKVGGLACAKCGCRRKYVKAYLDHIKTCDADTCNDEQSEGVRCGVCQEQVREWFTHIGEKHNYLAWVDGETPIDCKDKEAVHEHLYNISKEYNGLVCSQCGCRRKYVKSYLDHMKSCSSSSVQDCTNDSIADNSNLSTATSDRTVSEDNGALVTCGVCGKDVSDASWLQHIGEEHNYLAWKGSEAPLNTENRDEVYDYLYNISKQNNGLVCSKCGCRRKYVKSYLEHMKTCNGSQDITDTSLLTNISVDANTSSNHTVTSESENAAIKCGVCQKEMEGSQWLRHIEEEHNYFAWKESEKPLNASDKDAVYDYLYNVSKQNGGLLCSKCGCRRKYVKSYLSHIKSCSGNPDCTNDSIVNASNLDDSGISTFSVMEEGDATIVKCGVCQTEMENRKWAQHIESEHNYIAWKENETPLDENDKEAVYQHYYNIIQMQGELTCKKCGCRRKYAKSFLSHIQSCFGDNMNSMTRFIKVEEDNTMIKCGVCQKEMENKRWMVHIQRSHNYLAWKEGETPLDTEDEQKVNEHLYNLSKKYDGLTCAKCNVTKKYVKSFLNHLGSCDSQVDVNALPEYQIDRDTYECALCHEKGPIADWSSHAMNKHYNVAWIVGDVPIDVRNTYAVEKYLKEYKNCHKTLECMQCGLVRVSIMGFYAHVVLCGKTEEEMEMYKNICEICNNKYIGVYKLQHMKAHREQEYAQQRKLMKQEAESQPKPAEDEDASGKRRAAEKAKDVIKNFTAKAENKENSDNEIEDVSYDEPLDSSSSESEPSIKSEPSSEDESVETDIDSDVSENDKIEVKRKKKHTDSTFASLNRKRIPFVVNQPSTYISESAKEFCKTHFTSSTLFSQWLTCEYEAVGEDKLSEYMPPLMESCKVMYSKNDWTTYRRFEARMGKALSAFTGGCINKVRWAPGRGAVLAVSTHGADAPRLGAARRAAHAGMVQIWDFGDMTQLPSFVFGLAHDYGTVWDMDWCPSGAWELLPKEVSGFTRCGLLGVATSSGSAFIFSVPHPSTVVENDKLVYKLKPVAELRIFREKAQEFQATAISWSPQKGHSCIMVGYSNGTTAFFDLNTDSPLLKSVQDGVHIYYPFHDERTHSTCVTDVTMFAGGAAGGQCSASVTGVAAALNGPAGRGGAGAVLQLAASQAVCSPLWPSALLAGNSDIISQAINEIEWWGAGRRFGSMSAVCGCLACAKVAAFVPPLLKTLLVHPVFNDKREVEVRVKIDMLPLEQKNESKKKSLEKSLTTKQNTYDDIVKTHGIEFKFASDLERADVRQQLNKPTKRRAEQFPLSEVTSMQFCAAQAHHRRLAVAMHCGMLFVINT